MSNFKKVTTEYNFKTKHFDIDVEVNGETKMWIWERKSIGLNSRVLKLNKKTLDELEDVVNKIKVFLETL